MKEKIELKISELSMQKLSEGKTLGLTDLAELQSEDIQVLGVGAFPVGVVSEGLEFEINEKFEVTYIGEAGKIKISYKLVPEEYTTGNVTVVLTIESSDGLETVTTNVNGENTITCNGRNKLAQDFEATKCGEYLVKAKDIKGKEVEKLIKIETIDRVEPKAFTPSIINKTETGFVIERNAEDGDSTDESSKSGIEKYEYYVKTSVETNYTKKETNEIADVGLGTYNVYVIAYDRAGNSKQSETVEVKLSKKFINVSTNTQDRHSNLAIDETGKLWAWGKNDLGQLGDGTKTDRTTPVIVKEDTKFKDVEIGVTNSLAIDENGYLWSWGLNSNGQLGNGTTTASLIPIKIKEETKFKKISVGDRHCLAIDEEGNLWAWGSNGSGQIGDGTTTTKKIPVKIKEETKFIEVSAGKRNYYGCSMAIDEEGKLYTWGTNVRGILGNAGASSPNIPTQIMEGTKFVKVYAGAENARAIDENGTLYGWGYNEDGNLGDGTMSDQASPVKIQEGVKFKEVSDYNSTLAIDEEGNLWKVYTNSEYKAVKEQILQGKKFKMVDRCGAIDEDGYLWMWGTYVGDGTASGRDIKNPYQI